jgi:hypothetical protein
VFPFVALHFMRSFILHLSAVYALQTNFCPHYDKVRLGLSNISTALQGFNITAGVNTNTAKFFMTYDSTGQPISGLVLDVLGEISNRGGFSVNYEVVKTPKGYSLTKQLEYALPKVDIMVSKYYIDSTARRAAGIGFTYVWNNANFPQLFLKLHIGFCGRISGSNHYNLPNFFSRRLFQLFSTFFFQSVDMYCDSFVYSSYHSLDYGEI